MEELWDAVKILETNKSLGIIDVIPADKYKIGGKATLNFSHNLFTKLWQEEAVPTDFKNKGDKNRYSAALLDPQSV